MTKVGFHKIAAYDTRERHFSLTIIAFDCGFLILIHIFQHKNFTDQQLPFYIVCWRIGGEIVFMSYIKKNVGF